MPFSTFRKLKILDSTSVSTVELIPTNKPIVHMSGEFCFSFDSFLTKVHMYAFTILFL